MYRFAAFLLLAALPLAAAPVPKGIGKGKAPAVAGTHWTATDRDKDGDLVEFTFEEGGCLVYSYGGTTYANGTWRQDGDTLTWEMNRHYADYTLTFKDGRFEGTAKNTQGKTWDVTIRPDEK